MGRGKVQATGLLDRGILGYPINQASLVCVPSSLLSNLYSSVYREGIKMEPDSLELSKLIIGGSTELDAFPLLKDNLELTIVRNEARRLLIQVKTCVLAEEVDHRVKDITVEFVFPIYRNWWQHFKGEVFPEWLKRKFPPQFNDVCKTVTKKVTFRKWATYPKASLLFPKEMGGIIRYKSEVSEE
jgi:hypothetical protein